MKDAKVKHQHYDDKHSKGQIEAPILCERKEGYLVGYQGYIPGVNKVLLIIMAGNVVME